MYPSFNHRWQTLQPIEQNWHLWAGLGLYFAWALATSDWKQMGICMPLAGRTSQLVNGMIFTGSGLFGSPVSGHLSGPHHLSWFPHYTILSIFFMSQTLIRLNDVSASVSSLFWLCSASLTTRTPSDNVKLCTMVAHAVDWGSAPVKEVCNFASEALSWDSH